MREGRLYGGHRLWEHFTAEQLPLGSAGYGDADGAGKFYIPSIGVSSPLEVGMGFAPSTHKKRQSGKKGCTAGAFCASICFPAN